VPLEEGEKAKGGEGEYRGVKAATGYAGRAAAGGRKFFSL